MDSTQNDNIIKFNSHNHFEFITISIWINWGIDNKGQVIKKQQSTIGLRDNRNSTHILHPFTDFILNWRWAYNSYNTKRKHANNLVRFLNFLLENRKNLYISSVSQIDISIANTYLNSLTNEFKKRNTVLDAGRTLTYFYVWLSKQNCLPNVDNNYIESKQMKNPKNNSSYYESLFQPILPVNEKSNKLHLLPTRYIPLFLEIASIYAHPIALGIYLQIFGGLRVGEVVNIKRTQLKRSVNSSDFLLDIREQYFRTDIKDTAGGNYVKKNRKQIVLQVNDWADIFLKEHLMHYEDKDIDDTGALFINRDGKPMTAKSYSQYFYKVKNKFIDFLNDCGEVEDKIVAMNLRNVNWGTHIGRGTFTNLIAEEIENPAELMFMRGDSNLLSSLPYLAKTERVRKKVEERMNIMHTEYIPKIIQRNKDLRE